MSPSTVLLWLWTHAAQIAIAGSLFSTGYYVVTRSWRAHQSPTKPTWRVVIEVILELLPNIPSAVNKILIAFGKPGILPPAQIARTTRPSDGQAGFARVSLLLAVAIAMAVILPLGLALSGCPAHSLPPPSGCTPHAYRCSPEGRPEVCSATQRWTPIGDSACRDVHSVCCSVESYGAVVSACVPESQCLPESASATADGGAQ